MISNSIAGELSPLTAPVGAAPARTGKGWHHLTGVELPQELCQQVGIGADEEIVWVEEAGVWCTPSSTLSVEESIQVLYHVIRLRRAEPHLCFPSGHVYFYLDPESSYCQISDLAANLKGQNRYCGAVHWTVAQHLDLCGEMAAFWKEHFDRSGVKPKIQWELPAKVQAAMKSYTKEDLVTAAEIHDFAEGVMHDLNLGLKRALRQQGYGGTHAYDELEALADEWVRRRFPKINFSWPLHEFVKWIDRRAAWIEMVKLGFAPIHLEEVQEACIGACQPLLQAELSLFCTSRAWRDF